MAGETIFDVREISYVYEGQRVALEGISLQVQPGEALAVLGANGCGKSTLLKLLDGLYFPSSGSIHAFGEPLTEAALREDDFNFSFRRQVGFVFQDTDVQLFSASVLEEVAFAPLQLSLGREEVEQRVENALRDLRIESLRDRPPHRLSGGEKRRVALASILSLDPQVWLLDEPTTGLDPRTQGWLMDFILGLREKGRTVILATHDLGVAEAIATAVYVLDESHHLAAAGKPEAILSDHELLHRCNLSHHHVPKSKIFTP